MPRNGLGTKDIWVRDFLPVQVENSRFIKFAYRPDYLRGYPHLITGDEVLPHVGHLGEIDSSDLVVDGEMSSAPKGRSCSRTRCCLREISSRTEAEVTGELRRLLGVDRVILIPSDPHDEVGHADGVLRFLDDVTVAVNDYASVNPSYGRTVASVLTSHGLCVEQLPHFVEEYEQDGISAAVGNYINFLRVQELVVVPGYGSNEDAEAVRRLRRLLPGSTVVPLSCAELAREGGVLNCVSWTVRA
ncbi:MAG: agmatine deiminase family protein [Planctomycetes bacterium]|nr:agmatine deiminase family protein [Planctomycetota bacterium]